MMWIARGIFFAMPLMIFSADWVVAAELPPIKTAESNAVPECATPGRLESFVAARSKSPLGRFEGIGVEYMRHGQNLGVRWDYAFFQMMLETGNLTYKGDVQPDQFNFAGLGATGRGAPGERFKDLSDGVRAHLEHLVVYSGGQVETPVAERTRQLQEWGVVAKWWKDLGGRPVTFNDLANQWAPGSRGYSQNVAKIANDFFKGPCLKPDPKPDLIAAVGNKKNSTPKSQVRPQARAVSPVTPPEADNDIAASPNDSSSETSEPKVAAEAPASPQTPPEVPAETKTAKGPVDTPPADKPIVTATATPNEEKIPKPDTPTKRPTVTVLNATPPPQAPAPDGQAPEVKTPETEIKTPTEKALDPTKDAATPTAAPSSEKARPKSPPCRVWTASYGGEKALIIKAPSGQTVNYTVLDVNEGKEKDQADAYIAAYAKGGQMVGEFPNQTQALDKAFELCPE